MWITILNIALAIILFIGILCQHSLKSMFEKAGKNLADIFQNREKEYEAEKGRNIVKKKILRRSPKRLSRSKLKFHTGISGNTTIFRNERNGLYDYYILQTR